MKSETGSAAALGDALRNLYAASERIASILSGNFDSELGLATRPKARASLNWLSVADDGESNPRTGSIDGRTGGGVHNIVRIYVAGCEGLKTLSEQCQLPLFKIGTTRGDLLRRLAELEADRYGAGRRIRGRVARDSGFERWKFMTMDFGLRRASGSPVWIEPRALRVTLGDSISAEQFEDRLRGALKPISLATWMKTEEGRQHFSAIGLSPTIGERYTPYGYGDGVRLSRAEEIYLFRHRLDMPRLCRLIELIIHESGAGAPTDEKLRTIVDPPVATRREEN
jgi:hypothetical protein